MVRIPDARPWRPWGTGSGATAAPPRGVAMQHIFSTTALLLLLLVSVPPALADELDIDQLARGVIVLDVAAGSPAYRLRFEAGDILVRLNRVEIDTVAELRKLLRRIGGDWHVTIRRGGRLHNLVIRL